MGQGLYGFLELECLVPYPKGMGNMTGFKLNFFTAIEKNYIFFWLTDVAVLMALAPATPATNNFCPDIIFEFLLTSENMISVDFGVVKSL